MEKKSKSNILIIGGIVVFILCSVAQAVFSSKTGGGGMANGVIMQLEVLDSVLLSVLVAKKGFITALSLTVLNFLYTLVFVVIVRQNIHALPGIIGPLITIITCCIIYMYSSKVQKATDELREKNAELTETSRIIREKDEKLIYLAYYDVLTGLANRQLFVEQIDEIIGNNSEAPFTVVIADIDDFKRIIDAYGHNVGDVLLNTYAERLREYCGKNDFISKFGEEEFAVIINGTSDDTEVAEYIENLRLALLAPVTVNDTQIQITMSFGVSEYPANGRNSGEILRNTDIAVTNAKMAGRGRIFFLNQNKYM
ncbi:MAG: GGDEF domain-containing protein [Ruminococcus flavefaciens]|nr:GGDEF domain-containing protein [Ruminococcus flavefaciens]MCM1229851.1 GGDEF domain-containing protein [Ruminococcus flavefaciens]